MEYSVLAYYIIAPLEDVEKRIREHKLFLEKFDSKGRIYINPEGVNAQLSIATHDLKEYLDWLESDPYYAQADVKIHSSNEHAFEKLTIKFREQLVAVDMPVDFKKGGKHISPKEWREAMEAADENTLIVDVRNDYESKVGHFEGAICPDLETFREFPEYAEKLSHEKDPKKTKVLMYCTGGIRCEYYSAIMKEKGFENVSQLKGGVIRYGLEEGAKHWRGKLFVFDDRMVVPISADNDETIGKCRFCEVASDLYYNCANMDCNELFLSCRDCLHKMRGCCCDECTEAPRIRELDNREQPKPFRKLPFEKKQELNRKA